MLVGLSLSACKSVQKSVDVNKIYFNNVDEYPLFRGKPVGEGFYKYLYSNRGKPVEEVFYKYLYSNTVYPPIPYGKRITGRVFIEFIVERDGSISNTKVVGGADPMLEAEALRVVNLSQDWTPGKIDGKPVRMRYTFPINFRMGGKIEKSSSKKAKLSKETILLKEVEVVGFG
jgi:TonB family protein